MGCYHVCTETIQHCLAEGGTHAERAHINLLMDCAHLCLTVAGFRMRRSPYSLKLAAICSELCEECAKDCESFDDDTDMKRCVVACRACAKTCRNMTM